MKGVVPDAIFLDLASKASRGAGAVLSTGADTAADAISLAEAALRAHAKDAVGLSIAGEAIVGIGGAVRAGAR